MLQVSVAYASPSQQIIEPLSLVEAISIKEVIKRSGVLDRIEPLLCIDQLSVGVFGKLKSLDDHVNDGDRVEIYRALKCDPKTIRRERAKLEKAQKNKHK